MVRRRIRKPPLSSEYKYSNTEKDKSLKRVKPSSRIRRAKTIDKIRANTVKSANFEIKQLKDAKLSDDKLEKNLGKKGRLHSKSFYNDLIKRQQDIINNNKPATLTSLAKKHAMKLSGITTFLSTLLSASPAYNKGGKVK
tara:strand:- start:57 stop:476 length:420 start_codon:yes stop_codon:yes gene_type:complete